MNRFFLPARAAGLALLAAAAAGVPAAAQDQPVSFNHGYSNQGSAWVPTAGYLAQRYRIHPLTPTTPFDQTFNTQSAELGRQLAAWGRTGVIGVAHSNGGLVTRNYVRLNGQASRISRVLTIGTPHRGATVAQSVANGRIVNYFGNTAASIFGAFDFYAHADPDWNVHPVVDRFTESAFAALHFAGEFLASNDRFIGLGYAASRPVILDVSPTSQFISTLNGSASLAVESGVLSRRVGMATQVKPNGSLWRLISTTPGNWRRAQTVSAAAALSLYFYYRDHPDWWLSAHATMWLDAFWYITLIDVAWQDFIGAIQSWRGPLAVVWPSDAFIPHWSTQYPGATSQYNLYLPFYDISHNEQRDHPAARARLGELLQGVFGVQPRTATNDDAGDGGETCQPVPPAVTCTAG